MEPIIVLTTVLGLLQQVLRLGRLGCRGRSYPLAIRRLTISTTLVDLVPSAACRAVYRMMSWRQLAPGKPFDGLVLIMVIEMFDLRFHEMTCNAWYYAKKSAI